MYFPSIDCIVSQKMGQSSSISLKQISINCSANHSQPNFYSLPKLKDRYLSSFRGKLLDQECVYVLVVLMHQYFLAIRDKMEVAISDQLCKVTPSGEVVISSCKAVNLGYQSIRNYTIATSIILKITEGLCQSSMALWKGRLGCLRQQLLEIMCIRREDQQIMYNELLRLVEEYLETSKITCNLKEALMREQTKKSIYFQRKPYNHCERHTSYFFPLEKGQKKIGFCSSQVSVPTHSLHENKKIKQLNLSLTTQYSLNFRLIAQQQQNRGVGRSNKGSCIRKRYATAMLRQSCHTQAPSTAEIELHRNNTAINLSSPHRSSMARRSSRLKTVLDTMARLVEVREEPSSKSIIW